MSGRGFRYPFISATATIAATPTTMSIQAHASEYRRHTTTFAR